MCKAVGSGCSRCGVSSCLCCDCAGVMPSHSFWQFFCRLQCPLQSLTPMSLACSALIGCMLLFIRPSNSCSPSCRAPSLDSSYVADIMNTFAVSLLLVLCILWFSVKAQSLLSTWRIGPPRCPRRGLSHNIRFWLIKKPNRLIWKIK